MKENRNRIWGAWMSIYDGSGPRWAISHIVSKRVGTCICLMLSTLIVTFGSALGGSSEPGKYPTQPLEIVIPYAAGGPSDTSGRLLANALKNFFPQPITVVNIPGAAQVVGTNRVLTSKPDGYTVGVVNLSGLVNAFFATKPPYKFDDAMPPVLQVFNFPIVLAIPSKLPIHNLKEFVDYAKKRGGKMLMGNCGMGAATTMAGALFLSKSATDVTWVPFDGDAPAVTAMLGGNVEACSVTQTVVVAHARAGTVRVLGSLSSTRANLFPDVPTAKEQGFDSSWDLPVYVIAPKRTPQDVKKQLHDYFKRALDDNELKEKAPKLGLTVKYADASQGEKDLRQAYSVMTELSKQVKLK